MTHRTRLLLEAERYEEKMLAVEPTSPELAAYYRKHRDLCVKAAYATTVAPLYVRINGRETLVVERRVG